MSRRPNTIPSIRLTTALQEDVHTKIALHLYSPIIGAIPAGAWAAFIEARTREFFSSRELDLAPYAGTEPGAFKVRGEPAAIEMLEKTLRGELKS